MESNSATAAGGRRPSSETRSSPKDGTSAGGSSPSKEATGTKPPPPKDGSATPGSSSKKTSLTKNVNNVIREYIVPKEEGIGYYCKLCKAKSYNWSKFNATKAILHVVHDCTEASEEVKDLVNNSTERAKRERKYKAKEEKKEEKKRAKKRAKTTAETDAVMAQTVVAPPRIAAVADSATPMGDASSRVSAAAQELVRAAYLDAGMNSEQKLSAGMDSLKNTLAANLADVASKLDTLNENLELQTKTHRLQWAIDHAGMKSFEYKVGTRKEDSIVLVRDILIDFLQGRKHKVPPYAHISSRDGCTDETMKQFRVKLTAQIRGLTGVLPVIKHGSDNDLFIQYSS